MDRHAPPGQQRAQRLRQRERGRLRDRVGGSDRQGGERHDRHVVDDGSPRPGQQPQQGPGDAPRAEEVDGEVPLEHSAVTEVVVRRQPGVVDQDVEGLDGLRRSLDLRLVGHVQAQIGHPSVLVGEWDPCSGVHLFGASAQGFLDQCAPDASVRAGDQDGPVRDGVCRHDVFSVRFSRCLHTRQTVAAAVIGRSGSDQFGRSPVSVPVRGQ